ncbi:MAG: hypothetical protein ABIF10_07925 [Candidatus Woesearchaeota archaeon]
MEDEKIAEYWTYKRFVKEAKRSKAVPANIFDSSGLERRVELLRQIGYEELKVLQGSVAIERILEDAQHGKKSEIVRLNEVFLKTYDAGVKYISTYIGPISPND